jgi:hypothetical protein
MYAHIYTFIYIYKYVLRRFPIVRMSEKTRGGEKEENVRD